MIEFKITGEQGDMRKANILADILLKEINKRVPRYYFITTEKYDLSYHMDFIRHFSERTGILELIATTERFGEVVGIILDSELEEPVTKALEVYSEAIGADCEIYLPYRDPIS